MFTVCPKCALTLVVTAADLRVAQGYVRCGRCSNVFNAIVGLSEGGGGAGTAVPNPPPQQSTATTSIIRKAPSISDDLPEERFADTGANEVVYAAPDPETEEISVQDVLAEAPRPSAPRAPAPKPAPPAKAPQSPPPQKTAPSPPVDFSDSIPDEALEFNPSATDVTKVFIEPTPAKRIDLSQITGQFERVQLESEPAPPPPPPKRPAPQSLKRDAEDLALDDELRSLAARLDATGQQKIIKPETTNKPAAKAAYSGSPYNSADAPSNVARKAVAKRSGANAGARAADAEDFDADAAEDIIGTGAASALAPKPVPRGRKLAWIGGTAALAVALGAQAIHHNRHDLATNASFNRPLTRFYSAIGVPLVPRWNLALYDVRQLGAFSAPGDNGNLTVRASVKNTADQALPLPYLRITVQDRYGNRIATRDVDPKGYMPGAVPDGALLSVGQRIDTEMSFKDPGRDAVGFEIDACLPTPENRIACANETAAAPAR